LFGRGIGVMDSGRGKNFPSIQETLSNTNVRAVAFDKLQTTTAGVEDFHHCAVVAGMTI